MGHMKLADIKLHHIDHQYGLMLAGDLPRPDGERGGTGRPLGSGTVRLVHAALSQALSQAVKWGYLQLNPAAEATLPSHRPTEAEGLDGEERARFVAACSGSF